MNIQSENSFRDRRLHNFEENLNQPRHRWYPFKEGFSHQLVSEAIKSIDASNKRRLKILDPFGGSGTTPLTSALLGHKAFAIEVNPFCAFTAQVKCSADSWLHSSYQYALDTVIKEAKRSQLHSPLEGKSTFSSNCSEGKWLFNVDVLRAFTRTENAAKRTAGIYYSALRLAAIRAAMSCCNARKDGKCLRYLKDWREKSFCAEHFFTDFRSAANLFYGDSHLAPIRKSLVNIQIGDARIALSTLKENSFDLLVTSPPYLNSFDYSDVYRPELFLGGFVSDNDELREIRLRTLRSHIQVDWVEETDVEGSLIKACVDALEKKKLWSKRIPRMVQAYFYDMRKVLEQSARVLKPGADMWLVVSTSAYGGVHIPVDFILAELACNVGFELKTINLLRSLRAAGQQQSCFENSGHPLRESLIILKSRS